ncbi:hypothetical protein [Embleya sp. NPDC050493]|uniref:hypothetical protein n=1 Tax=Embleya sp. NPDC050493 TaxID=3363989 RepID=UPI00379AB61D
MSISARRGAVPAVLAVVVATGFGGPTVGTAHADTPPRPPATSSCNPTVDSVYYDVTTRVTPVITDFLPVYIAEGTTGQRTETLTQVDSVATTVDNSEEFSASVGPVFAKVAFKVGFSVSNTKSSTRTNAITNTWNFNKTGYYGLYRGTRRVDGRFVKYICAQTGPTTGIWINAIRGGIGTYTTFETPEIGTVVKNCIPEPVNTVRRAAQDRLGPC